VTEIVVDLHHQLSDCEKQLIVFAGNILQEISLFDTSQYKNSDVAYITWGMKEKIEYLLLNVGSCDHDLKNIKDPIDDKKE